MKTLLTIVAFGLLICMLIAGYLLHLHAKHLNSPPPINKAPELSLADSMDLGHQMYVRQCAVCHLREVSELGPRLVEVEWGAYEKLFFREAELPETNPKSGAFHQSLQSDKDSLRMIFLYWQQRFIY